jgi:hypothetical protein
MDLTQILKGFGQDYGVPDLALDEAGAATLVLDGGPQVLLLHRPAEATLYLRIPLDLPRLAPHERARLYRRLLIANLSGDAVFAVDPEEERLELHRRLVVNDALDMLTFTSALEALYGAARQHAADEGLELSTD